MGERQNPLAPLVSCLMVTRGDLFPARFAIDCYRRQSWAARELVIVRDAPAPALDAHLAALGDTTIRIVEAERAPLGSLRNVAVDAARGALVCQWDDDDLYDDERIARQAEALVTSSTGAVFLERWTIWQPARRRIAVSGKRAWEGSMLARKDVMSRYPPLARGEDTAMVLAMVGQGAIGLLDAPDLYCYVLHGANSHAAAHADMLFAGASRRFEFAEYEPALDRLADRLPVAAYAEALGD